MSATTYGWLVIAFPLAGTIVHQRSAGRCCATAAAPRAGSARSRSRCSFLSRDRDALPPRGARRGGAPDRLLALRLREHGRRRRADVDPGRPAVGAHGAGGERRVDAHPPLLGHLHGVGPGHRPVLRLPELLRLLDAHARDGGELPRPHHRVGVRRRRVVPADLVLVPAADGDARGHQGLRRQRRRRRRPRPRHVLHLHQHRDARLPRQLRAGERHPRAATSTPG